MRVLARGGGLLAGLPAEFAAGRYHSLHAVPDQVKGGFTVTAVTPDGVVMAIEDTAAGRWAVQFHPESILTASGRPGHQVIANVLRLCRARSPAAAMSAGPVGCRAMRPVQPEVFLVARPEIDYEQMAAYLREVGGENWLERLDRGELDDAQNLAEFAGKCATGPGSRA